MTLIFIKKSCSCTCTCTCTKKSCGISGGVVGISAHDNVRSSDNFRPIRACDRLCAIMVGQNVRARDNAHN